MTLTARAVTAVADFGETLCVHIQTAPEASPLQMIGTLESVDETGLALGDAISRTPSYLTPDGYETQVFDAHIGTVFIPWSSVRFVTDRFEAGAEE